MLKKLFKKAAYHLRGLLWGYPKPCTIMTGLRMTEISVLYHANINRPDMTLKVWIVAVRTVQPDFRYENHAAWMLHILSEHAYTIAIIAEIEHVQQRQAINSFKQVGINNLRTIKIS